MPGNVSLKSAVQTVAGVRSRPTPARNRVIVCAALGLSTALLISSAQAFVVLAVFHTSGKAARYDAPALQGLMLAVSDFNASGGLGGDKASLQVLDPGVPASRLSAAGSKASAVVLGPALEVDEVLKVGAATALKGPTLLLADQGSAALTGQFSNRVFLSSFGDNVQGASAAQFAMKRSWSSVLILQGPGQQSADLARYFRDAFFKFGGQLATAQRYSDAERTYRDPEDARRLRATLGSVQAVYLACGSDESSALVKTLRASGVSLPIIGPDRLEFTLPGTLSEAELGEVYATSHVFFSDSVTGPLRTFMNRYEKAYASAPQSSFSAVGFDAGNMLFSAVRRSKSAAAASILEALSLVSSTAGVTGNLVYARSVRTPQAGVLVVRLGSGQHTLAYAGQTGYVPDP